MLRRTSSRSRTTSCPATRARPPVGLSSVHSMLIVVDLPAPFGPRNPKISPGRTGNSSPRTASPSPKVVLRPSTSTAGPPSGMGLPPVGAYAPSPARGGRRRETTRGRQGRSAHRDGGLQAPAGLVVAAQDQAGHGRVGPDRRGAHARAARRQPAGGAAGRQPGGRGRPADRAP